MKLLIFSLSLVFVLHSYGQNVGINTDGSAPTDPKAMLEVKKGIYSKLKVRSLHYDDTSVLELSNRTPGHIGTDIRLSAIREQGLYINSVSDLALFNNDSIMVMRVNGNIGIGTRNPTQKLDVRGNVRISSLAGTGNRQVYADASGLLTTPVINYYNIGIGSFIKFNTSSANTLLNSQQGVYMNAGSTDQVFAGITLPHGARVTSIKVVFLDNSVHDLQVRFNMTFHTLPGGSPLHSITLTGNDPSERTIVSPFEEVIDNNIHFYYVIISPAPGDTWDSFHLYVKSIVFTFEL